MDHRNRMPPPQLPFAGPRKLFTPFHVNIDQQMLTDSKDQSFPPSQIEMPYTNTILRKEQKDFLSFQSKSREFKGGNPSSGWSSSILPSNQQGGGQQPKAKRTPRLRYNLVFPSEVKYDTKQVVNNTHEGRNLAEIQGAAQQPNSSNEGVPQPNTRNLSQARQIRGRGNREIIESPAHTNPQFSNIPSPTRLPTVQSTGATPDRKRSREQSPFPETDDEGRARKRRYPGSASVLGEVPEVPQVPAPKAIMVPQDHKRPGHVEESKGAAPLELPIKFSAEKLDFPTFEEEISVADLMSVDFDQLEATLAAEALSAPQETEEGSTDFGMLMPDVASISGLPLMQIQETTAPESNTIQEPAAPRYTFELPSSNYDQSEDWFLDLVEENSYQH